jgi:hypothetical protein
MTERGMATLTLQALGHILMCTQLCGQMRLFSHHTQSVHSHYFSNYASKPNSKKMEPEYICQTTNLNRCAHSFLVLDRRSGADQPREAAISFSSSSTPDAPCVYCEGGAGGLVRLAISRSAALSAPERAAETGQSGAKMLAASLAAKGPVPSSSPWGFRRGDRDADVAEIR